MGQWLTVTDMYDKASIIYYIHKNTDTSRRLQTIDNSKKILNLSIEPLQSFLQIK